MAEFDSQPPKQEEPSRTQSLLSQYVPGFSLIKNSVIKPLLVASERIVEQMMPEREPYKLKMAPEYEDNLDRNIETTTKHDTISLISGEDQDDKKFRK